MLGRKSTTSGKVDGGAGRGVPLGGRDERAPTGYREVEDDLKELSDRDFEIAWDDEVDPAERRRDPLRKP